MGHEARIRDPEMGQIQDTVDNPGLHPETEMTMGMRLRRARQDRGILRKDAAVALRISDRYLQGFEEDNIELLPEPVYSVGFLRSYAYYLGLDPVPLLEALRESLGADPFVAPVAQKAVFESQVPRKAVIGGGIACAVLLVLAAAWWRVPPPDVPPPVLPVETAVPLSDPDEALENEGQGAATAPEVEVEAPALSEGPEAQSLDVPVPAASPVDVAVPQAPHLIPLEELRVQKGETLEIRALARTWIEVRASGRVLIQRTLAPGEVRTLVARPGMTLSTGNAAGVVLATSQTQTLPLGGPGQVLRGIVICPEDALSAPAAKA